MKELTHSINAASVINDLMRRGIAPDRKEIVSVGPNNGMLEIWQFNVSYLCRFVGDEGWSFLGGPYYNTVNPTEITADLIDI